MNDQELAASARETARKLFASSSDNLVRQAAGQLLAMADRLDGRAAAQATEGNND